MTTRPTAVSATEPEGADSDGRVTDDARVFWPFFVGTDNPISYLYEMIAPHVASEGFDVTVLSPAEGRSVTDDVRAVPTGDFDSWQGRLALARHSVKQYDLLHTGGIPLLHYPTALLNRLRNRDVAHVHTFRIDADPDSDRTPTGVRRRLGRQADRTTAVSKHTAATVESAIGVEPTVIYNAVDTDLFHPGYDRPSLLSEYAPERPVFLYVGSFEKRKRPLDVVEVAKQVPEATFLFVGGKNDRTDVTDEIAAVENAHYVGRVPKSRLPALYSNSSGLVFPSTMEGCPNVVLEAFASGTPVIGYEATSMPELVADGQRGYLTDIGDIDGLVAGVRAVLDDTGGSLGEQARSYITENHTFETIARQYTDVYRDALAE